MKKITWPIISIFCCFIISFDVQAMKRDREYGLTDIEENEYIDHKENIPISQTNIKPYFINLPEDVQRKICGFLNAFDYKNLLFVNHKLHDLYWHSLITIVATTPRQMDVMKIVFKKLAMEHPQQLLMLKNVGFWSVPGRISSPIDREMIELLHRCHNIVRIVFGKGPQAMKVVAKDFQLLRSLARLELIEVDQLGLDDDTFTTPINETYCFVADCKFCSSAPTGKNLIEHFSNLKSFRVRGVNYRSEKNGILSFLGKLTSLKKMGLWTSEGNMADTDILALKNMPDLTEIILSNCRGGGDRTVFQHLATLNLQHLGLFYAENSNENQDDDFIKLAKIPTLTTLQLSGWNLTNQAFLSLKENDHLLNLTITTAQSLSKAGFLEIAQNKSITSLRISACIFVSDFDLAPILSMKQLQRLDLDNTKSITNNFLKILAESETAAVSELYVMGITLISDDGIAYLEKFRPLKVLVVKNCPHITDEGVRKLKTNHFGTLHATLENHDSRQQQEHRQQEPQHPQHLQTLKQQIKQKLQEIQEQQALQDEQGSQPYYIKLEQLHYLLVEQQKLQKQARAHQPAPPQQPIFQPYVPLSRDKQPSHQLLVHRPEPLRPHERFNNNQ